MRSQKKFLWVLGGLLLVVFVLGAASAVRAQTPEPPTAPATQVIDLTQIPADATEISVESEEIDTTGSSIITLIVAVSMIAILIYAAFEPGKKKKK